MEQVLQPFDCIQVGDLEYMRSATTVLCSLEVFDYKIIYYASIAEMLVMLGLFILLIIVFWYSYSWQFGNRVREYLPIYVAVTETFAKVLSDILD